MVITGLKATKKHGRVNVYLDGDYSFTVYYDTLLEYSLKTGSELDDSLLEEIKAKDGLRYAKFKAFEYLSRSPYSIKGMKRKLAEKGFETETAEKTVDYLLENRYLDDEKYAADLCEYLVNVKKFGERRVRSVMYEKGLDRDVIDRAVSDFRESDEDDAERLAVLAAKVTEGRDLTDEKIRRKAVEKLLRQGYDYDEVCAEIKKLCGDVER